MPKFRKGQRVVCISPPDGNGDCVGLRGTVVQIADNRLDVGVEFDEPFEGGHFEFSPNMWDEDEPDGDGCSWWCEEESLRPIDQIKRNT